MATMPEHPCRQGHPELKLWRDMTTFYDRLPVLSCPRCGTIAGFEEAVRNDERQKWAAEFDKAAHWHRDDARGPTGPHQRGAALGLAMAAEQLREATQ